MLFSVVFIIKERGQKSGTENRVFLLGLTEAVQKSELRSEIL